MLYISNEIYYYYEKSSLSFSFYVMNFFFYLLTIKISENIVPFLLRVSGNKH